MTQVLFDTAQLERFLARLGGSRRAAARRRLAGAKPRARTAGCTTRCRDQRPGPVLDRLERAGADAAREGMAVARDLLAGACELAAGAYLVPPFKEPELVLELLTGG